MTSTIGEGLSMYSLLLTFLIITITYLVYKKIVRPYREYLYYQRILKDHYKLYVHPYSLLGLGSFKIFSDCLKKYGDSHYVHQIDYPYYQVTLASFNGAISLDLIDPELIKEFNQKQLEGFYVKGASSPFASTIKHILGSGLLFSEGSDWKRQKKIMSNVFNHQFLRPKIRFFAQICQDSFEDVEKEEINKDKNEIKVDIGVLFQKIFGNIIIKSFFGNINFDQLEGKDIFTFVSEFTDENVKRSLTPFAFLLGPNYYKYNIRAIDRKLNKQISTLFDYAKAIVLKQIEHYKSNPRSKEGHEGIIEYLVKENKIRQNDASKDKNEGRDYYTIKGFIDEFITFFLTGTDTTSSSTSMLIYLLALHPKVEEKLRKEVDEHFKSPLSFDDFTYENLKKVTYYDDVFKQTLRMYNPADGIFGRVAVVDHYVGKIPIKKGSLVCVKIKPNHFKEQFYDHPLEFDPDRWANHDPLKKNPYCFFPFSSGHRICIGQHIALLQSKVAVIFLLKKYGKITLQKPIFKKYIRTMYGPQKMITTLSKLPQ